MEVSRRDFVKMVGAGAAVAGMGSMLPVRAAGAASAARPATAPMPKAMAENIRWRLQVPDSTDPLAAETVQIAPNMEPVIPHSQQAAAASPDLPSWASPSAISDVFAVRNVPAPRYSLDGGTVPAGVSPAKALHDAGVDVLPAAEQRRPHLVPDPGAGATSASGLRAKQRSSTGRPPIRCSWMMRSSASGVQPRYQVPSG